MSKKRKEYVTLIYECRSCGKDIPCILKVRDVINKHNEEDYLAPPNDCPFYAKEYPEWKLLKRKEECDGKNFDKYL